MLVSLGFLCGEQWYLQLFKQLTQDRENYPRKSYGRDSEKKKTINSIIFLH